MYLTEVRNILAYIMHAYFSCISTTIVLLKIVDFSWIRTRIKRVGRLARWPVDHHRHGPYLKSSCFDTFQNFLNATTSPTGRRLLPTMSAGQVGKPSRMKTRNRRLESLAHLDSTGGSSADSCWGIWKTLDLAEPVWSQSFKTKWQNCAQSWQNFQR